MPSRIPDFRSRLTPGTLSALLGMDTEAVATLDASEPSQEADGTPITTGELLRSLGAMVRARGALDVCMALSAVCLGEADPDEGVVTLHDTPDQRQLRRLSAGLDALLANEPW